MIYNMEFVFISPMSW